MFKTKTINSIKDMEKQRKSNAIWGTFCLVAILGSTLSSIYLESYYILGIGIFFSASAICFHTNMRYWDLKKHLLLKTKLEASK